VKEVVKKLGGCNTRSAVRSLHSRGNAEKTRLFKTLHKKEKRNMKRLMYSGLFRTGLPVVALMLFGILIHGTANLGYAKSPASPSLAETEVEWRQIVGIIAPGNTVGSGTGKATGGGTPWTTSRGNAEVNLTTGDLRFNVEGLVLAGGNSIGTPDGVTTVKGTLVCDTTGVNSPNSVLVDSSLVPLDAQGDAKFKGNLGILPAACTSQPNIAFLIRTASGGWIASGMVRVTETDDDHDRR
jgi:hypothetical protein